MPAKAVVFNSIRKHDGNQFRVLEPGEYTQVSHFLCFDDTSKIVRLRIFFFGLLRWREELDEEASTKLGLLSFAVLEKHLLRNRFFVKC